MAADFKQENGVQASQVRTVVTAGQQRGEADPVECLLRMVLK